MSRGTVHMAEKLEDRFIRIKLIDVRRQQR